MKKLILLTILLMSAIWSMCSAQTIIPIQITEVYGVNGKITDQYIADGYIVTVYEDGSKTFGHQTRQQKANYTLTISTVGPLGVYDEAIKAWFDTCYVGMSGYKQGKDKPQLIVRKIIGIYKGNIVQSIDSSAFYAWENYLLDVLDTKGQLEVILPDAEEKIYHKDIKSKNKNSVHEILYFMDRDLTSIQIADGVLNLKDKGKDK